MNYAIHRGRYGQAAGSGLAKVVLGAVAGVSMALMIMHAPMAVAADDDQAMDPEQFAQQHIAVNDAILDKGPGR